MKLLGLSNTVTAVNKKRGGGFPPVPQPKKEKKMLDSIIKIILKWISSFNWNGTWEKRVDDEIFKLGGRCWNEDTHPVLNNDGTWKKSIVTQIPVSFGKLEWGDVEKDVPLIECMDAVVDEITFNKRARKLFLLLLIGSFKDNPSQLKG